MNIWDDSADSHRYYYKLVRDIETSKIFKFQFSKSLFLFIQGGQENIFIGPKNFLTIKNSFLSPFNKQKQRFGELEFEYFGGSDVANKLVNA